MDSSGNIYYGGKPCSEVLNETDKARMDGYLFGRYIEDGGTLSYEDFQRDEYRGKDADQLALDERNEVFNRILADVKLAEQTSEAVQPACERD